MDKISEYTEQITKEASLASVGIGAGALGLLAAARKAGKIGDKAEIARNLKSKDLLANATEEADDYFKHRTKPSYYKHLEEMKQNRMATSAARERAQSKMASEDLEEQIYKEAGIFKIKEVVESGSHVSPENFVDIAKMPHHATTTTHTQDVTGPVALAALGAAGAGLAYKGGKKAMKALKESKDKQHAPKTAKEVLLQKAKEAKKKVVTVKDKLKASYASK
jgi:hypothetical protein